VVVMWKCFENRVSTGFIKVDASTVMDVDNGPSTAHDTIEDGGSCCGDLMTCSSAIKYLGKAWGLSAFLTEHLVCSQPNIV
jgi:hypothetical protein